MSTTLTFKTICLVIIIFLIIAFIPVAIYWYKFKNLTVSSNINDWALFGNYVGGISGTLLTFFAVIFSLTTIYFTAKISKQIQDNEFAFNEKQSNEQLKTLHQQSKPYPYLHLSKYNKLTAVTIQNMGLGPLIITSWNITYDGIENYRSFRHLLVKKYLAKPESVEVSYNSAPQHILAPNTHKRLLKIKPSGRAEENFEKDHSDLRKLLEKSEVFINYEDIFGNKFQMQKKLDFFY